MVVSVARIVMLPVRLGPENVVLFLGTAICTALRVPMRWKEAGNEECGKQEARHSHGSSPLPGDMKPKPCPTDGDQDEWITRSAHSR
jgi:hypothetical protein